MLRGLWWASGAKDIRRQYDHMRLPLPAELPTPDFFGAMDRTQRPPGHVLSDADLKRLDEAADRDHADRAAAEAVVVPAEVDTIEAVVPAEADTVAPEPMGVLDRDDVPLSLLVPRRRRTKGR